MPLPWSLPSEDLVAVARQQYAPARSVAVAASNVGDYCAQVTNRVLEDGCLGKDGDVRSRRRGRQLLGSGKAASHLACRGKPPDQHSGRRAARSAISPRPGGRARLLKEGRGTENTRGPREA